MAGEAEPLAPAAVAGEAPAPVAASPAAAPVAAPVVEAAPVVAPVVETPAAPAAEPTLLQKFDAEKAAAEAAKAPVVEPAAGAKPAEVKPEVPVQAEAKPGEPKPEGAPAEAAPAAPQPVAYEYTLPETIKLDDTTKASFHTALDAFRADPAKGAQGLVDLHNQTMQDYANHTYAEQVRVFNETRREWTTQVMADEELGGAGHNTSMAAIARMRDLLVPESRREAFNNFLVVTGAGDHPEFLRILHNAARIYDEAPMPPPGARPPPSNGRPQGRGLRGMYKPTNPGRQ